MTLHPKPVRARLLLAESIPGEALKSPWDFNVGGRAPYASPSSAGEAFSSA